MGIVVSLFHYKTMNLQAWPDLASLVSFAQSSPALLAYSSAQLRYHNVKVACFAGSGLDCMRCTSRGTRGLCMALHSRRTDWFRSFQSDRRFAVPVL